MVWPACSPDLNPIEALWDQLGRAATAWIQANTTLDQLRNILTEEWNAIDQARITHLMNSMRRRCVACIDARGGYTRYWEIYNSVLLSVICWRNCYVSIKVCYLHSQCTTMNNRFHALLGVLLSLSFVVTFDRDPWWLSGVIVWWCVTLHFPLLYHCLQKWILFPMVYNL